MRKLKDLFNNFEKKELAILLLILVFSSIPRFAQLGYSHFYGDETKALYTNKTITAQEFFLNQRKGPVQFFVAWSAEKVFGEFNELTTRIPFALAGVFSIIVFYILVKKVFDKTTALFSTTLFAFSGFNVAFSRTVQYQSFLILFGLLSILFFYEYTKVKNKKLVIISSIFMGLAFLSHYDAIFFLIPIIYMAVTTFLSASNKSHFAKQLAVFFVLPLVTITCLFYIPYLLSGYFEQNTLNYISKRVTGSSYKVNNSFYTFFIYNPILLWLVPFSFLPFLPFFETDNKQKIFFVWFGASFFVLEFLLLNPGTHIHNYFIPLYVLSAVAITKVCKALKNTISKTLVSFLLTASISFIVITSIYIFIPLFNYQYPWEENSVRYQSFHGVNTNYHLYLYGFPYNAGWNQIRDYMYERPKVSGFYTNDNDTVAQYYLKKLNYTIPGTNFWPEYYVHVFNNQEFTREDTPMFQEAILNYKIIKVVYVDDKVTALIFKK